MPGLLLGEYYLGMKSQLVMQKHDREMHAREVPKLRMSRIFKAIVFAATKRNKNVKGICSGFQFR